MMPQETCTADMLTLVVVLLLLGSKELSFVRHIKVFLSVQVMCQGYEWF